MLLILLADERRCGFRRGVTGEELLRDEAGAFRNDDCSRNLTNELCGSRPNLLANGRSACSMDTRGGGEKGFCGNEKVFLSV